MSKGMSHFVLVIYSNALASFILFPAAFFFTRKKQSPITLSFLCKIFCLSIAGYAIKSKQSSIIPLLVKKLGSERVSIGDNVAMPFVNLKAAVLKGDLSALMLSLDIELISMVYSALFGNVITWCIWRKGLVFVAKFKPLSIFVATLYVAAFLGFIFLGDSSEEGRGGRGGEGNGVDVCEKVKGLVIGGMMVGKREGDGRGMKNDISVKSITENDSFVTYVT
ncbi:hypothetical protein Goklo_000290 [Gossypium klotzschianum]|uniref:WAT1-related protein n=1 Tax=Gossypium klotzschianum TaxID=34286 RepID=A0A7J8VWZ8_9ROSI|nr:hypothetical protein [Gossypium klotzschianum]